MKILKGTVIKEGEGLGRLVVNICLNDGISQSMRDKANYHFKKDPRDKPLYSSISRFKKSQRIPKYIQRKRRIVLHTSEGRLGGIILFKRSLHARAKGTESFVEEFYNLFKDQY